MLENSYNNLMTSSECWMLYSSFLPPAEQQRDKEWFDDLHHNISSFKQRVHSWIKDAEAERQVQLSSKRSASTKDSSQIRSSGRLSSKASSRSFREKRAREERIKMAELMAEAECMEKKKSMEFENLRNQLAAEVAKSKAQVKTLEAPSEVPDDAQATLKSETSNVDQQQKREEMKWKSQKELPLSEKGKCDTNFGKHGKVYQALAYEKQGDVTIACLVTKFRGYRCVKSCMPPTK